MRTLLTLLALLCVPSLASADAVVTLCQSDQQAGAGTNLASALTAGGRIRFECPTGTTIQITAGRTLDASVDIDGQNRITLDAGGKTHFFDLRGATRQLTLRNLTLRKGSYGGPQLPNTALPDRRRRAMTGLVGLSRRGAIFGDQALVLDHVTILETLNPVVMRAKVTVDDSHFVNNIGTVLDAPNLAIEHVHIEGTRGAAVYSVGGTVTIDDLVIVGLGSEEDRRSVFARCSIDISNSHFIHLAADGAAFADCDSTRIFDSTFEGNRGDSGGALEVGSRAGTVEFSGVRFEDNQVTSLGGALFFNASGPVRTIKMSHTTFRGNAAKDGGAIHLGSDHQNRNVLQGYALTFTNNRATGGGGAIAGINAAVEMERTFLLENEAGNAGTAIALEVVDAGVPDSRMANCLVARNRGPGAAIEGRFKIAILNSTIAENAGSGLGVQGEVRLINSVLSGNAQGNCRAAALGGLKDLGHNVQFGEGGLCGASIPVVDPKLDTFFIPALDSPLNAAADDLVCKSPPVRGTDAYGQHRPRFEHCSIGAIEGDIEQLIHQQRAPASAVLLHR